MSLKGTFSGFQEKMRGRWPVTRCTHATRTPQTLSRHQESRTMIDRRVEAWSLRGQWRGRGSSFSFLSAIDGNYTLYSLVLRGTPGIIALRFCSAIRRAITRNRVRKGDRKELAIIKQMRPIAEFAAHSRIDAMPIDALKLVIENTLSRNVLELKVHRAYLSAVWSMTHEVNCSWNEWSENLGHDSYRDEKVVQIG